MNSEITSFIAGGTISEFQLVSVNAQGKVEVTVNGTDKNCVGIAQRGVTAGEAVDVITFGISKAIAGGVIAPATDPRLKATSLSGGKVETVAQGDFAVCRMIPNINQVAAANGDQITVLFIGPTIVHA